MPPKKQPASEKTSEGGEASGIEFTPAEVKIMNAIFLNCPTDNKITPDWEAVRVKVDSNSVEACKKRLSQISQKYGWFQAKNLDPATPTPKKAARTTSSKKKKKAAELGDEANGDGNAPDETPVKKRKPTPKKSSAAKAATEQNDEPMDDAAEASKSILDDNDDDDDMI